MKKNVIMLCLSVIGCLPFQAVRAQEQEIEQLALNIEKLLQFRKILSDMKEGYDVLVQGYQLVTDISQGNFNLHKLFLDGLMEVSPAVKKYERIAAIVSLQVRLVKEYKAAFKRFRSSNLFNTEELAYTKRVYTQLFRTSLQHISDLTTFITAGKLRMSDEERLKAIDVLYEEVSDELVFVRRFNNSTSVLLVQRVKDAADIRGLKKISDR